MEEFGGAGLCDSGGGGWRKEEHSQWSTIELGMRVGLCLKDLRKRDSEF